MVIPRPSLRGPCQSHHSARPGVATGGQHHGDGGGRWSCRGQRTDRADVDELGAFEFCFAIVLILSPLYRAIHLFAEYLIGDGLGHFFKMVKTMVNMPRPWVWDLSW